MKMKKTILLLFTFQCSLLSSFAQDQHLIDSLETKLKKLNAEKTDLRNNNASINDTSIANTLDDLSYIYWGKNPEKAMDNAKQCLKLSEQIGYKKGMGNAYNSMGTVTKDKGDYLSALEFYKKALKIREEIADKKSIASTCNNIGIVYGNQGNYPEALKIFFSALKVREELGDKSGIASSDNNIGIIYFEQRNTAEALNNFLTALKIRKELGDQQSIASSYANIGSVYKEQGNFSEALKNQLSSLKIFEELGVKNQMAICYNEIGLVYKLEARYPESLKNYFSALKIFEELGDKFSIASSYTNIGVIYTKEKNYNDASQYLTKGLSLSKEVGSLERIKCSYEYLAALDSAQGKLGLALEHYKLYIATRDSLLNNENTKKTVTLQMNYEFNKKQVADSVRSGEEKKVISAELKQEQTKSYALYGGVALLLVFGGFMFNRFRVTQKQKNIIAEQKNIVEEKQKEIIDSINYARRIQRSLLPTERYIERSINRLRKS